MAFTSAITKTGVMGDLSYIILSWVATGVTTGSINVAMKKIVYTEVEFTTAAGRATGTINDTAVAGRVTLNNISSGDAGFIRIFGYAY